MKIEDSPKYREAEERLPAKLRQFYKVMVSQYSSLTELRYGKRYVAYEILADMVLAGWRQSAESHPDSKL